MKTKKAHEGYLLIDQRAGGGVFSASDNLSVKEGCIFESATSTCSHCQRVIILNPDRSRSRGYCPKCDHYVCDQCELVRISLSSSESCTPFKKIIDDVLEAGEKNQTVLSWDRGTPTIVPASTFLCR